MTFAVFAAGFPVAGAILTMPRGCSDGHFRDVSC